MRARSALTTTAFQRLNLVEQQAAGDEAIESLLAGGLTFEPAGRWDGGAASHRWRSC